MAPTRKPLLNVYHSEVILQQLDSVEDIRPIFDLVESRKKGDSTFQLPSSITKGSIGLLKDRRKYVKGVMKDGLWNGAYEEYFGNGQLKIKSTRVKGSWDGSYEEYLENGALYLRGRYKDGFFKRRGD